MAHPFLETYTLSSECSHRLSVDTEYALSAFQKLLGSPYPSPSPRGWYRFECPTEACSNKGGYKLGIMISTDSIGGYHCFRCGLKGKGFINLCRELGQDPGLFVDATTPNFSPIKPPLIINEQPLTDKEFSKFWSWVALRSKEAYGPTGIREDHRKSLELRSLEINKLPYYFSMPPNKDLDLILRRFGGDTCTKAATPTRASKSGSEIPGRFCRACPSATSA